MGEVSVTESHVMIVGTRPSHTWSEPMNEERIYTKLDEIQAQNTETLVALGKLQEQIKEVPDLRLRLRALEQWRWMVVGALAAGGGSLATQLVGVLKGGA